LDQFLYREIKLRNYFLTRCIRRKKHKDDHFFKEGTGFHGVVGTEELRRASEGKRMR